MADAALRAVVVTLHVIRKGLSCSMLTTLGFTERSGTATNHSRVQIFSYYKIFKQSYNNLVIWSSILQDCCQKNIEILYAKNPNLARSAS